MDETNFNLFVRRTQGRSKKGARAVAKMPCSKGPNIHMIGAISSFGKESIEIRRGSFKWENANDWMERMVTEVNERGVPLDQIVVVCDNAPVHSRFETVAEELGFTLLRLGPYSPMLNPIENIWSVVKAKVKRFNRIPVVAGAGIIEQRLQYLEDLIRSADPEITPYLCSQTIGHSHAFHRKALAEEDMQVGR